MNAEIIMIGSELLLGQIIDTNSAYLAQELARIGINLFYKTTVGDNRQRMAEAVRVALGRADIVITSGGLGPTEDDLTREVVADVFGAPLEFHQGLYDQIEELFKRHGFTMSPNNRKQAFIPRGATPIENPVGTAPGFVACKDDKRVIVLPGVPRELKYLMQTFVTPYLRDTFSLGEMTICSRVLKICGMGESRVDARVGDLLRDSGNPTLGILAEPAQILLRITAKADNPSEAQAKIAEMEQEIRSRFGQLIFGVDEETLEGNVNALLLRDGKSLSLLETHTGGAIAQRFVSIGSAALREALVANSDAALSRIMGREKSLWNAQKRNHEAISVALGRALREQTGSDIGLAVVGIAPNSEVLSPEEMATGKTCIVIDSTGGQAYWEIRFSGTDPMNQTRATALAIEMLRRYLAGFVDPELPTRAPRA
ncbi:MAG: CinA family nicotinamide mononucleotide deamidase-related protein [Candidatus Abyssobacteria bacterium SURF_17]|uniref:CinA-like protein n=1 Tax=Candidatus Abyssobacteria bacterium SURF_17 TaxID=2093361 RepID=A0A419EMZ6_9BACT|nr:MAG: CinA family nicotinamide mononucleotide deamidase-related protein [Candidatus Abyssubacteria bacterium SURF_17]